MCAASFASGLAAFEPMNLETGLNATAQRRKDAERSEVRWDTMPAFVHLRDRWESETIHANSLCDSASLRPCVKPQLRN